jgi:hypothetical protein
LSCCGRGPGLQRPSPGAPPHIAGMARSSAPAAAVVFEYVGSGAIVVTGPMTGATYRFAGTGSRATIHGADAPSLVGVPGLKPVR